MLLTVLTILGTFDKPITRKESTISQRAIPPKNVKTCHEIGPKLVTTS